MKELNKDPDLIIMTRNDFNIMMQYANAGTHELGGKDFYEARGRIRDINPYYDADFCEQRRLRGQLAEKKEKEKRQAYRSAKQFLRQNSGKIVYLRVGIDEPQFMPVKLLRISTDDRKLIRFRPLHRNWEHYSEWKNFIHEVPPRHIEIIGGPNNGNFGPIDKPGKQNESDRT